MDKTDQFKQWPRCAAVFGASGGIGGALCQALVEQGVERVYAGSRSEAVDFPPSVTPFTFDLDDEPTIKAAADVMRSDPPDLVIIATGVLTLANGSGPERSYKMLDGGTMAEVFRLNTIGPALIAKHVLPLFPRDQRRVLIALSARVGSIGDNRIGGWHSYRASKAALNMLLKNLAIELSRTHKQAVVAGLHPGTVDTPLSEPFQANLPAGQLTEPDAAARNLLAVIEGLQPEDSGQVFDWQGKAIPN